MNTKPGLPAARTGQAAFIDRVARLCRLSPERRAAAIRPLSGAAGLGSVDRTCIDGGGDMMLTFAVPINGPLTVGVASALPQRPAPNVRLWRRWDVARPTDVGRSLIFGKPRATDWEIAVDEVEAIAAPPSVLAELRTRGSVYMTARDEPGSGRGWLSFGLYHRQSPRQTLAALGQPQVWATVRDLMTDLLGRPLSDGTRPWSIAVSAAGSEGRIRIGTTIWARMPEHPEKARRLARQIGVFGHDRDLVSGLYNYCCGQARAPRGVGVAAEFDFEDGAVKGAHYTLRVPPVGPGPGFLKEVLDGQD